MQFFGIEEIKPITKASQTTLEWEQGSNLRIGGKAYKISSNIILNLTTDIDTGTVENNKIYYIYAVAVSGVVSLKYSLSSEAPTGFAAFRKIGSFSTDGSAEIVGTSNKDEGKVGDVIHSMLTVEQFIEQNGAGWVAADGRDVTGSKYALVTGFTTVPDMRGEFLRGLDNMGTPAGARGKDVDGTGRTVGQGQADAFKSHFHRQNVTFQNSTAGGTFTSGTNVSTPQDSAYNTDPTGGTETRPTNVGVNIFIKIEDIQL